MKPKLMQIVGIVKSVLEEVPELAEDIIDKGIVMIRRTSLLKNLDKLLTQETGVTCHVAEEPPLCVAKGQGLLWIIWNFINGRSVKDKMLIGIDASRSEVKDKLNGKITQMN